MENFVFSFVLAEKNYSHSVLNVNGRQSESVLFVNSFILHLITKLLFVCFFTSKNLSFDCGLNGITCV